MSRWIRILLYISLGTVCALGAEKPIRFGRIVGLIVDSKDGSPIVHANVVLRGTKLGTVSNADGYFKIENISPGIYEMMVTMLGYRRMIVQGLEIPPDGLRGVRVRLNRKPIQIKGIEIRGDRAIQEFKYDRSIAGHEIITPRLINTHPGAFDDAYRALKMLPGVVSRNDFNTQLYIRGGSPDQNLILYDGIEITTPSRLFIIMGGGISLVNPDIIQAIDLVPAGFEADYGNKMSALMQISNREGRRDQVSVRTSAALLTARATVEGPLARGRGSWLIAGRRSFYDLIANSLYSQNYVFPFYYDIHAKINYDLSQHDRLSVYYTHLAEGAKMLDIKSEKMDILNSGRGDIFGVKLNSIINQSLAGNLVLGYYKDKNNVQIFDTYNYQYHANLSYNISRVSLRGDLIYFTDKWLNFKTGAQLNFNRTDLLWNMDWRNRLELPDSIDFIAYGVYNAAYWMTRMRPAKWLEITSGVRYDYSTLYNEAHWNPRIRLLFTPMSRMSFWISYGLYSQFPDFLTIIGRGEPLDIAKVNGQISAESALHQIAGYQWNFSDRGTTKIEVYRKTFDKLLVNKDEVSFTPQNSGHGIAQGIEISFQHNRRQKDRLGYWLNFSVSEAKYKRTPDDAWTYFEYDQRFQGGAGLDLRIWKNLAISSAWHYNSGFPYTPVLGVKKDLNSTTGSLDGWQVVKQTKNSARYPYYLRLDLRISYTRSSSFSIYLDLINVLNRRNIYMFDWRFEKTQNGGGYMHRNIFYMLPFLPSFGVQFTF